MPAAGARGRRAAAVAGGSCVRTYGLTHFKIKLWGDAARDLDRLRGVADVIDRTVAGRRSYAFTLDGNENFKAIEPFRRLWDSLTAEPSLERFMSRLHVRRAAAAPGRGAG